MKRTKQTVTLSHYLALSMLITVGLFGKVHADTLLGGYVGVQGWNMGTAGGFAQDSSTADFEFEDQTNVGFYAALEHPIPLIPNIKVARTAMDTEGTTVLDTQFTFADEVFLANSTVDTSVEMTATDYILYYELLDNDLITIDVGLSAKQVEGDLVVVESGNVSEASFDAFIPMAYGKFQFGIPATDLGIHAEGTFLSIDDDSLIDYQVAIYYDFVESLALDMRIMGGYRTTTLEIEDLDDIYADMEFDGVFLGLELDF